MRSKILYTAGSIVTLLVVPAIFFSIHSEGFLRRNEAAVTQAEIEAAGAAVSFTGKKAGADIPRVTGAEDFMVQYPFSQFTVEPVNAIPTGVYELARWQSSTAVVVVLSVASDFHPSCSFYFLTPFQAFFALFRSLSFFPPLRHIITFFPRR